VLFGTSVIIAEIAASLQGFQKMSFASVPPAAVATVTSSMSKGITALTSKNISIIPIMCSRRVLIRSPYLTADEMHGLAYRLSVLGTNGAINSILIARDSYGNGMVSSLNDIRNKDRFFFEGYEVNPYKIDDCYLGSAPFDGSSLEDKLLGLAALAKAVNSPEKAPIINYLNGIVADGGYALCMCRYVVSTLNARFQIRNPSRGLSFDPIGFSFILNRLGKDYNQSSAQLPAAGKILALTSYLADGYDMVATGLATHFGDWLDLPYLERALGQIPPYETQVKVSRDRHKIFKVRQGNVENKYFDAAVANTLDSFMSGNAAITDIAGIGKMGESPESTLLNYAEMFHDVFAEDSVEGIMDGLKKASKDPLASKEYLAAASKLLESIKAQSPIALLATFRLYQSSMPNETWENCMSRERQVFIKLIHKHDYQKWRESSMKGLKGLKWKHSSVGEVTKDELDELFE
jgi:enoyl-CoA hydratase/carnithine racemase